MKLVLSESGVDSINFNNDRASATNTNRYHKFERSQRQSAEGVRITSRESGCDLLASSLFEAVRTCVHAVREENPHRRADDFAVTYRSATGDDIQDLGSVACKGDHIGLVCIR